MGVSKKGLGVATGSEVGLATGMVFFSHQLKHFLLLQLPSTSVRCALDEAHPAMDHFRRAP